MNLFEHRDSLFSIVHARNETFLPFQMHTHTFAELYCFLEGRVTYHVEGNRYELSPGDILLMRPAEAHYIDVDPDLPYERLYVSFDIRLFDSFDPDNRLLRPYFDRKAGTRNHYSADPDCTAHLMAMTEPGSSRAAMLAHLVLLLETLGQRFGETAATQTPPDSVEYRMIRYINQNLHQELSLDALCDRFFISRAQLCRRFHAVTGTSVGRYITVKRLILARQLLLQGQKPTEIYNSCGFQDYATFFRAYKRYFGHAPKDAQNFQLREDRTIIE